MSVVENLILAWETRGAPEAAAQTDTVTRSVERSDTAAKGATASHAKLSSGLSGLASSAKSAAGMIGVAGLAFGIADAVRNVEALQEAQAQLRTSIQANVQAPAANATESMTAFADSLSTKGGFAPIQAIQAMTQFLRVTGSVTKSQSDLTLATNIARGAHVDLGRAVRAVTMLEQGRTTGLSRLGIVVKPVTSAYDQLRASVLHATPAQVAAAKAADAHATRLRGLQQVTKQYSGATATYSHTAAGAISNLGNAFEQLSVQLGKILLPIITTVAGALQLLMPVFKGLLGVLKDSTPVLIALGAAWTAYKVVTLLSAASSALVNSALIANTLTATAQEGVMGGLTAAWYELDAAMDANPFMLIITVIALVVIGFIELYKHVGWFRDLVKGAMHIAVEAFNWLKNAAVDVFNFFKAHWPLLVGILLGPIAFAAAEIIQHWSSVKQAATDVWHWVVTAFNNIVHFIEGLPGTIARIGVHLWDGLKHGLVGVINWIIDRFNGLPFIHGFHLGPIHVPGLPTVKHIGNFQAGGPVTQTGAYLVGERGPEVVTLPAGSHVTANDQLAGGADLLRAIADRPIVIYNVLDGRMLSKSVVRQGLLQMARGG